MWLKLASLGLAASLLLACKPDPANEGDFETSQAAELAKSAPQPDTLQQALGSAAQVIGEKAKAHLQQLAARKEIALALPALGSDAQLAQSMALRHPVLRQALLADSQNFVPAERRVEVFAVYPLRESDLIPQTEECRSAKCFRVELYDYARNTGLIGIANVQTKAMVAWHELRDRQPEIPDRLREIAIEMAIQSPEVKEALGGVAPSREQVLMPSTKTALNGTRCERSRHLCVAPTFVQGNVAIWAIVDLSEFRVVGVQWTELNNASADELINNPNWVPSEQTLSDQVINQRYCERNTRVQRDGWQLDYMLTASDGLRVADVRFNDQPILNSAKLVDWHVNYSERSGFGYSDAVGCPSFSSAAVVPFAAPTITEIERNGQNGFRLEQEFRSLGWPQPCNYSYRQAFEFFQDGSFRPIASSIGAGCGNDGTYRPVLRIEPAGSGWRLSHLDKGTWLPVKSEQYFPENGMVNREGVRFQLSNKDLQFAIVPGRGQFADSRGDFEWSYVTANHPQGAKTRDEGASDLITLGSCCNTDHHQGPEAFLNSEVLQGELVFWYVPQLKNDVRPGQEYCWAKNELTAASDREGFSGTLQAKAFPCESGPLFRRVK